MKTAALPRQSTAERNRGESNEFRIERRGSTPSTPGRRSEPVHQTTASKTSPSSPSPRQSPRITAASPRSTSISHPKSSHSSFNEGSSSHSFSKPHSRERSISAEEQTGVGEIPEEMVQEIEKFQSLLKELRAKNNSVLDESNKILQLLDEFPE
eukprot:c16777_g1_i1.p1 GENE.c16777_g1_i1~~c16777_g1_i1.p1  ORF type:complete len:164 (-),score=54.91 c16777_g1_i1:27-488(-)